MRKITKIEIITRANKLEDLKEALNAIGVQGMTVARYTAAACKKVRRKFTAAASML